MMFRTECRLSRKENLISIIRIIRPSRKKRQADGRYTSLHILTMRENCPGYPEQEIDDNRYSVYNRSVQNSARRRFLQIYSAKTESDMR